VSVDKDIKNILEYLSGEEHNLLVSLHNLKDEVDWLYRFDKAWQDNLSKVKVSGKRFLMMRMLCNDCHVRFYVCFASLFRARLAEYYSAMRRSIDGTLHAYREYEDKGYCEKYLVETPGSEVITNKRYIQDKRKSDPSRFTLADSLLQYFDAFSSGGPHADPGGISIGHYTEEASAKGIPYSYFQVIDKLQLRFWYFIALANYLQMYKVFDLYSKEQNVIVMAEQQKEIEDLTKRIENYVNSEEFKIRLKDSFERKSN